MYSRKLMFCLDKQMNFNKLDELNLKRFEEMDYVVQIKK